MRLVTRRTILAGAAAVSAVSLASPRIARAATTTLRLSTPDSATHSNHAIVTKFANLVSERTSGAIAVKIFPDGQLGTMANALTGVQTGTIDMMITGASMLETVTPELGVLGLPFVFPTAAAAEKVIDGDVGRGLDEKLAATGVEILAWSSWGWRVTETAKAPIKTPADFKGLKIRLPPGPVIADTFTTLGAIPTVVDATELYLAVSQGTVDAFEVPFLSLVASKWYEVVKFVSLTNHSYNPVALAISKTRLDSLDPAHAKIVRETAAELKAEWRARTVEKSLEMQKFIEDQGIQVVEVDTAPFRELLLPVYERVKAKVGAELVDQVLKESAA